MKIDIGASTPFLWMFEEREKVMNIFYFKTIMDSRYTIEFVSEQFKCLEKLEDRICSRCIQKGFRSTPAFYRFDDSTSVYLCDNCHSSWHNLKLDLIEVPKIPDHVAESIILKQQESIKFT